MDEHRYVYLGDRLTDPSLKDQTCNPVLSPQGKCIVGKGKQWVVFADGRESIVLRRRLRLIRD